MGEKYKIMVIVMSEKRFEVPFFVEIVGAWCLLLTIGFILPLLPFWVNCIIFLILISLVGYYLKNGWW
jgi:hypothetical protein